MKPKRKRSACMTSLLGKISVTQVRRGQTTNRLAYFEYYQQFTHFNRVRVTCMQETHQNEYIHIAFLIEACAYSPNCTKFFIKVHSFPHSRCLI